MYSAGDIIGLVFFVGVLGFFAFAFVRMAKKTNRSDTQLGLDGNGDPVIDSKPEIAQVELIP